MYQVWITFSDDQEGVGDVLALTTGSLSEAKERVRETINASRGEAYGDVTDEAGNVVWHPGDDERAAEFPHFGAC